MRLSRVWAERRFLAAALAGVAAVLAARPLRAAVVQMPEGGRPVTVVARGVVCGTLTGGWTLEADRRTVRPPAPDLESFARTLDVKVADEGQSCAASKSRLTLVALGGWPDIDPASIAFFPDDGRIELHGMRLRGVQVAWTPQAEDTGGAAKESSKDAPGGAREGNDLCLDPQTNEKDKRQTCVVPLAPGLAADAPLYWIPPYGKRGADVATFDSFGNRVDPESFRLRPARVVLTKPLIAASGVDVSQGPGRVPLSHPEAIASVDCGLARCDLGDRDAIVRSVAGPAASVALRMKLVPRVYIAKGDALETTVTTTLPLLSCPMTVVPGSALRDADDPNLVVKLDPSCGRDPRALRWHVDTQSAEVRRSVKASDGLYVLLHTARMTSDRVVVTAARADIDGTIVASAAEKTTPLPQPRASLELTGSGKVDFVPTNRPASVRVAGAPEGSRFVLLPVDGAYTVQVTNGEGPAATAPPATKTSPDAATPTQNEKPAKPASTAPTETLVRGDENAGGFVSLRFGYRLLSLPPELAAADLTVVLERVQRAVREASVPAPFSKSAFGADPLVELLCTNGAGATFQIPPSRPFSIPYVSRETCRVVIHRERLRPEDGNQEIMLEVAVTKPDGSSRADVNLTEHMVLRPGGDVRSIPIKGGLGQFDRVLVRISHVADENRYVISAQDKTSLPAVQWTAVVQGGHFRLYGTASIPAGLYRVTEPTGQLTLNFGVLSRLTRLNEEGKESLLGLELGVMGLGLVPTQSSVTFPRTLAGVAGLGLRLPLGGGAAVGIQAWMAYEFRDDVIYALPAGCAAASQCPGAGKLASHLSFIFGPSISIGNVGVNL